MTDRAARPDDHRRKWDVEEYEALAREREIAEEREREDEGRGARGGRDKPPHRELLRPRDYKVDLESKLGKSQVITKTTPSSQLGGYFCNVCDCIVKDSINFLDHINGKKHSRIERVNRSNQRNLGMSMKVERSSLDQVKRRFEQNKRKLEEKKKEYDFEERIKELKDEEERHKLARKERQKDKKKRRRGDDSDEAYGGAEDGMSALMGFSGFGGSKK